MEQTVINEKTGVTMVQVDKWSWKRFGLLVLMVLMTAAMTVATLYVRNGPEGSWILMTLCGVLFSIMLVLNLEWNRLESGPFHEKANNFTRITIAYIVSCVLTVGMSYLPEYARPVLVVSAIMTVAVTPFAGLLTGCYASVLLVFSGEANASLLACYLLCCVCGCVVTQFLLRKSALLWGGFMLLATVLCLCIAFSMMEGGKLDLNTVLYGVFNGVISGAVTQLLFKLWNVGIVTSKATKLQKIIGENYHLVKAMKSYSKVDYAHARKVSEIARICARKIHEDEHLAAAAGFYYRLGRLEGEPYVENGVALAMKNSFPPELLVILAEYNGEKQLPSTVLSALIHMVDNVVAKFDVLDKGTLSSSWNQDIVVYQTLNDNSSRGLYDQSGLSMNMFLAIRDFLIKEADLYDSDPGE